MRAISRATEGFSAIIVFILIYCFDVVMMNIRDNSGFSGGTPVHTFMPLLLRFSCFCWMSSFGAVCPFCSGSLTFLVASLVLP